MSQVDNIRRIRQGNERVLVQGQKAESIRTHRQERIGCLSGQRSDSSGYIISFNISNYSIYLSLQSISCDRLNSIPIIRFFISKTPHKILHYCLLCNIFYHLCATYDQVFSTLSLGLNVLDSRPGLGMDVRNDYESTLS